jgi:hypothetical protein
MPGEFANQFIAGLHNSGITLPENWQLIIHILNLLSLLDCLARSDNKNCQNKIADLQDLIEHILNNLLKACEKKSNV